MSEAAATAQRDEQENENFLFKEKVAVSRPSQELVIGMVGAVGAGVSTTARILKKVLEDEFGYTDGKIITVSKILDDHAEEILQRKPEKTGSGRITDMQKVGNTLRERAHNYLAFKAIEEIGVGRSEGGYQDNLPVDRRTFTIIDSLKHPAESELLREVYGKVYWQFTVFAPEDIREKRLERMGVKREEISKIFGRDENDEFDFGQNVLDTAHRSDVFIRNDAENDSALKRSINRFLDLIFQIDVSTPTKHETGMYAASSAAFRAGCMSRQVGASIYSRKGELLGVGWNDVPKAGGGLYSSEDGDNDHRCFRYGEKICHNDHRKELLYQDVYKKIPESDFLKRLVELDIVNEGKFQEALKESKISADEASAAVRNLMRATEAKNLIEYSRSIHAEMEAIISVARAGKSDLVGATMYTTTYPCHNCARHIVAAGISKVYYVEPYSKSLALELHGDAISNESEQGEKVRFLQYQGIGPKSMYRIFNHEGGRKVDGRAPQKDKKAERPVSAPSIDGFTIHEDAAMMKAQSLHDSLKGHST